MKIPIFKVRCWKEDKIQAFKNCYVSVTMITNDNKKSSKSSSIKKGLKIFFFLIIKYDLYLSTM